MKKTTPLVLAFAAGLLLGACKKEQQPEIVSPETGGKIAPNSFTFSTSKSVSLNIRLLSNNDQPLKGIVVNVYTAEHTDESSSVLTAVTDDNGYIINKVNVPAYADTLIIDPSYIGLIRDAKFLIESNTLDCTLGGLNGVSSNVITESSVKPTVLSAKKNWLATTYSSMGLYGLTGRPLYLELRGDVISSELLSFINTSLPEGKTVPETHPSYISEKANGNLDVLATSDVWITFVSEGAGNLNTFGYYTYRTDNPPTKISDIDEIKYIFPNASMTGSGGSLSSGDKVKLGRFEKGTSVGFVLLSNAWNSTLKIINTNTTKFFSNAVLNPETNSSLRKHSVLLFDDKHDLFVIGFEDLQRDQSGCDNDFNDIVVYATANPVTAISQQGVEPIDEPTDTDKDGVTDIFDQFPKDASKAYISYYPTKETTATLAFEDNWPKTGDYDMNDLVVNYKYSFISNAQNKIVQIIGDYTPVAAGASFHNGLGISLPLTPSQISKVTGYKHIGNYISLDGKGLENKQTQAVIFPFDDPEAFIKNEAGSYFINTMKSKPNVSGGTARVVIDLASPVASSLIASAPFNPFIVGDQRRGYEAHLPGQLPTDLADKKLFGTDADDSSAGNNRYYVSKDNWPWAINFTQSFTYPVEGVRIDKGYLHFFDWTKSGGASFADWYNNTSSGYRSNQNLFIP